MHFIKQYPLSILITIVVIALSLLPIGPVEMAKDVPLADKWTHMVMYAGLTAVCCWERKRSKVKGQGSRVGSQGSEVKGQGSGEENGLSIFNSQLSTFNFPLSPLLYSIFLGGLMELMQAYCTTYRSGEWLDFVADSVGAVLGLLIMLLVMHLAQLLRCSKHEKK